MSTSEWRVYRRVGTVTARPYVEGEALPPYVSISDADRANGSPKVGDMIARDVLTKYDEWLINAEYFARHYEATPDTAFGEQK